MLTPQIQPSRAHMSAASRQVRCHVDSARYSQYCVPFVEPDQFHKPYGVLTHSLLTPSVTARPHHCRILALYLSFPLIYSLPDGIDIECLNRRHDCGLTCHRHLYGPHLKDDRLFVRHCSPCSDPDCSQKVPGRTFYENTSRPVLTASSSATSATYR